MRYIVALISGGFTGAIAILLHQSIPPFGVIASLLISYISIWMIGRKFHSRNLKFTAAIGWVSILLRGSSFGTGQELLVQGDGVGSTLLLLGTFTVLAAVAARI